MYSCRTILFDCFHKKDAELRDGQKTTKFKCAHDTLLVSLCRWGCVACGERETGTMPPKSLLQLSLEWEENGGDDNMDADGQLPDSFKVRADHLSLSLSLSRSLFLLLFLLLLRTGVVVDGARDFME